MTKQTTDTTTTTEIAIAESRLPLLVARIDKLNTRGARFGCADALAYEIVERYTRNVRFEGRPVEAAIPMVRVRIVGKVFTINGWTFAGRIECTSGGNIVHRSPDAPSCIDFEAMRNEAPSCNHCNTNRRRIDCFVLHNASTGESKLVGRSCLADYLRDADEVKAALKAHKLYLEISEWTLNWNAPCPGSFGSRFRLDVATFLAFVVAAVRLSGWVRGGVTAELADDIARGNGRFANESAWREAWPKAADFEQGAAIVAWAANMDAGNEYTRNLKAACASERVDPRNRNLVASAWIAWDRAMQRNAEQGSEGSGHFGTVGESFARMLKVTRAHKFDGRFGECTLVSMVDRDGNRFKWFAAGDRVADFERGACYKLAGTIKAHGAYKGVDETQVTRCRVLAGPLRAAA